MTTVEQVTAVHAVPVKSINKNLVIPPTHTRDQPNDRVPSNESRSHAKNGHFFNGHRLTVIANINLEDETPRAQIRHGKVWRIRTATPAWMPSVIAYSDRAWWHFVSALKVESTAFFSS